MPNSVIFRNNNLLYRQKHELTNGHTFCDWMTHKPIVFCVTFDAPNSKANKKTCRLHAIAGGHSVGCWNLFWARFLSGGGSVSRHSNLLYLAPNPLWLGRFFQMGYCKADSFRTPDRADSPARHFRHHSAFVHWDADLGIRRMGHRTVVQVTVCLECFIKVTLQK